MHSIYLFVVGGIFLPLLAACGGSSTPTPAASAPVTITLNTNPDPPKMGDVGLQFTVLDDQGQPVSDADFDVIADHTEMNGMTMHGKATHQGNGLYAIDTNFSMSGKWLLTVQVKKDTLNYKQDINLQIQ